MTFLKSRAVPAPNIKIMINVGACLDIPTGVFVEGRRGEYILLGGLSYLTGVVGIGNNFKSTLLNFLGLQAMARFHDSTYESYDTEVNVQEWHQAKLASRIQGLETANVIETGRWTITDKTVYYGNEWYEIHKEFLRDKRKNATKYEIDTPFWNRGRTGCFKMILPTFSSVDSFTEFETEDVAKMQDSNELGDSGGNTIHMRQGLAKLRLLMEAPALNGAAYNYMLMTAHIGKESTMQNAGPGGQVPIVKLKHLKNGDKIKGTTDKFTFVTHNCYHCFDAKPLIDDGTKGPMYPRDSDDKLRLDTDLNVVQVRNLRSKSGAAGMAQQLIVSQSEGVLPSLTEFHHIKEMGRFGLEGNNTTYALSLYPDCKIGRTTVRGKLEADARLRQAMHYTSELCQMSYLWHHIDEFLCSPKQLYDDLKALGYNWDLLLDTRAWWTATKYEKDLPPFLSTMDLLRMRKGLYHPYWYPIKKEDLVATGNVSAAPAATNDMIEAMRAMMAAAEDIDETEVNIEVVV